MTRQPSPRLSRFFARTFFALLLSLHAVAAAEQPPATAPTMPVSDLRPGMKGITYTVMQGSEVVPVKTEILGVARNFSGPGLDLIIGKLVDPKTDVTGAVHGMSGSPLYVDGKLVGALSRRIARFEKDGHCGFTPINDMFTVSREMDTQQGAASTSTRSVVATSDAKKNRLAEWIDVPSGDAAPAPSASLKPPRRRAYDCSTFSLVSPAAALSSRTTSGRWMEGTGDSLIEREGDVEALAIPLSVNGPGAARIQKVFNKMGADKLGFLATPTGGSNNAATVSDAQAATPGGEELKPGSAVAAVMMVGSLHMAGTGTLTWRDGNKILAFGHPMLSVGKVDFPMGTAEIITTIPSYMRPYKMSNTGKVVGTIAQDRLSAIAGVVGPVPPMAKYRVARTHNGQARPVLEGEFAKVPVLVPQLLASPITGALFDNDDISRFMSVRAEGEIKFAGHPPLKINGFYTGDEEDVGNSVLDMVGPAAALYNSHIEELVPESIDLKLTTDEKVQLWGIEKISTDRQRYEPGSTVTVYVDLREIYGAPMRKTITFTLPENLKSGSVKVRVAGGGELNDSSWKRALLNAKSIDELINLFNRRRVQNQLWLQVATSSPGEIVGDADMPALPPAVREVMQSGNRTSSVVALNELVWLEQSQEIAGAVTGREDLTIQIK